VAGFFVDGKIVGKIEEAKESDHAEKVERFVPTSQ
jgi:hypothetical protein